MIEITANLFYPENDVDAILITTNGFVKKNGQAVMGRGVAYYATVLWPDIQIQLGVLIKENGNQVMYLDNKRFPNGHNCSVYSFPVKKNWWEKADLELIENSVEQIKNIANMVGLKKIWTVRPGCGNGKLDWNDVKPILLKWWDDRFIIVNKI